MATRTWLMKDLESVANSECTITLQRALLVRIAREASDRFDAPNGIVLEHGAGDAVTAEAVAGFAAANLPQLPRVKLRVTRVDARRVRVQVGAQPGAGSLGFSSDFDLIDETPAEVFLALFACALESVGRKPLG